MRIELHVYLFQTEICDIISPSGILLFNGVSRSVKLDRAQHFI